MLTTWRSGHISGFKMTISQYHPQYFSRVIKLFRLNTPGYFAEAEEAELTEYLTHHAQNYFIIEIGGEIMGSSGYNIVQEGTTGVLSWDIIHPQAQGKGTGTALVKFRIQEMQQLGIKDIKVRTSQHTYKFYEKMGFSLNEVVIDYWANGYDLYSMCLPCSR